jgi:hypothetical protein
MAGLFLVGQLLARRIASGVLLDVERELISYETVGDL